MKRDTLFVALFAFLIGASAVLSIYTALFVSRPAPAPSAGFRNGTINPSTPILISAVTVGESQHTTVVKQTTVQRTITVTRTVTRTVTTVVTATVQKAQQCNCSNATLTSIVRETTYVTVTTTVPANCVLVRTETVTLTKTVTSPACTKTVTVTVAPSNRALTTTAQQKPQNSVTCIRGIVVAGESKPVTCVSGYVVTRTTETVTRTVNIMGHVRTIRDVYVYTTSIPCPFVLTSPATVSGCIVK